MAAKQGLRRRIRGGFLLGMIGVGLLAGCIMPQTGTPSPSVPTALPSLMLDSPTPTTPAAAFDIQNAGWQTLAPGLESRVLTPDESRPFTRMTTLRIDPAWFTFRVQYRPGEPLTTGQWRETLPGATVIVNANFFDTNHEVLGMIVADGVVYGRTFTDRGGMFQVENGAVRVRSLLSEPYGGEPLEQAVQAFPVLVYGGQTAYTGVHPDRLTRRTLIGQDAQGRIILLVTPLLGLTLTELSAYLPTTDLEMVNAFNLDGGGSTMVSASVPGVLDYAISSFDPVPAVLAIYPR